VMGGRGGNFCAWTSRNRLADGTATARSP
jgi:hypothetical protein